MSAIRVVLVCLLALQGCATLPATSTDLPVDPAVAQARREQQLSGMEAWSFRGRLAVSQAGQGGSGSLEWRQQGEDFDIRLSAPVTRQSWRLSQQAGVVRLSGLEGGERVGSDAESLLQEAIGWPLPVTAMADWVRGLGHADAAELEFGSDGLPARLREQGWTVEFRAWDGQEPRLPIRLNATRDDASVRLVIDRWERP